MIIIILRVSSLDEILLNCKCFLVGIKIFSCLDLCLNLLHKLLLLFLRELLLCSLELCNITSSISHLSDLFLRLNLGILLKHPVCISLGLEMSCIHNPSLWTKLRTELVVMGNHYNSTIEILNCSSKCSKRFTIKVICWFVQNKNMRLVPHSCCKYNLHLLSSRKSRHTVMSSEFTSKTTILKMLFNILGRKWAYVKSCTLCNLKIDSLHCLLPSHLFKGLCWKVVSRVLGRSSILNFIFVLLGLVGLTSANKLSNNLLYLGNLSRLLISEGNFIWSLLKLLFFLRKLHGYLNKRFLILSLVRVTPTDVLIWSFVEVILNVMESMLCYVSNTSVRMLPNLSNLWLDVSNKKFNHGGLSCSVLSNTSNTGRKRYLYTNIKKCWFVIHWVSESTTRHLHKSLSLGFYSLNWTWLWELELHLGSSEVEVGTSLRLKLHKFIKISLESMKLQVLNLKDVGTTVVKKSRIMGYNNGGYVGQRVQVVLYPCNIDDIKMVCWFIQKKNICLLKH